MNAKTLIKMKKTFTIAFYCLIAIAFFLVENNAWAQCASGSSAASGSADIRVTQSSTASCQAGATYYMWNVCAGDTYRWSTCGSGSDTQITVRNSTGATQLAYNDDNGPACTGSSASVDWVSTVDGQVRVYLHQYSCQANSPNLFCAQLIGTRMANAPLSISCPSNISVNTDLGVCGATVSYSTPSSSGACESVARIGGQASGSLFAVGSHTVTYRATDVRGATQNCSFNITVTDNQAPAVTCKSATVTLNASGNGSVTTVLVENTSSDNCSIDTKSVSPTAVDCSDVGTLTATLTVTDDNGNTSTCSSTVTVADNIKPLAACKDVTVDLDGTGNANVAPSSLNDGTSEACGIDSYTLNQSAFTCADIGVNAVQFRAIDVNGNTSDPCSANVTVQDVTAPNASCQNATVNLDASGNGSIVANDVDGGTTDNCNVAFRLVNPTVFVCGDIGSTTVTFTAEDDHGNTSNCTATVTVVDNVAPSLTCKNATVQLNATGQGAILPSAIEDSATDACGIDADSRNASPNTFDCDDVGVVSVTLSLADQNGNTGTCTANVTVQDNLAPSASCNSPIFLELDASGNATLDANDVDNGSTDNCPNLSLSLSKTAYTCADLGFSNTTLTVTDAGGNTATCDAGVITQDLIAPNAVCQDATVVLDGTGAGSITGDDLDGGSTDNCAVTSKTPSVTDFDCTDIGTLAVTLTVSDLMGNTDVCSANVTVEDNAAPSLTCNSITVNLDGSGNASINLADIDPAASDNCGITSSSLTPNAFTCTDIGTVSVSVTASDQAGNSTNCNANVTVVETTPPDAQCVDYTVNLSGGGGITGDDVDGGSTDNCGIDTKTVAPNSFGCAELGANSVTLTVTDLSGNSSSCAAIVTVVDDIAPTAVCADYTVTLDGSGNGSMVADDIDGGSTDNCVGLGTAASQTTFDCSDVGTPVSVTLTVTDASGNSATCSANVTVVENTPPTAVCGSTTVGLDTAGEGSITGNDVDGGSTDNCGIASATASPDAFNCSDIGVQTVTLTVTDDSGNTASCTASVTVEDNLTPTAKCEDITVDASGGPVTVNPADFDGGSADNCINFSLNASQTVFDCTDDGTVVTLTATDDSGHSDSCTSTVTVLDAPPTALCSDVTVQLDPSGNVSITAAQVDGGSSDDCGTPTLSISPDSFDCSDVGVNAVTLTVTDINGNTSSCSANVTVEDSVPPTATCNDYTVVLVGSNGIITVNDVSTMSDNCSVASSSVAPFRFKCSDVSTPTTVTVTVTDVSGNSGTCTASVTTVDNEVPSAICKDITINVSGSPITIVGTDVDNGSDDNCVIASYSVSPDTFDSGDAGPNGVVLTVTDQSGNTSTCSATVTVNVTVQPRLKAKVYLEGPYLTGGLMSTTLRDGLFVPASNPFSVAPWNNAGGESVASASDVPAAAVDWVWIELRSAVDYSPVASRACFVLADGTIAELDGSEGAEFAGAATGVDYYVIIRTRNHVDVLSSGTVQLSNVTPYDFTSGQAQVQGVNQLVEVETGVFALTAGDVDANGVISVQDHNAQQTEMSFMNGYYDSDLNMDDNVTVDDLNQCRLNASKIGVAIVRY